MASLRGRCRRSKKASANSYAGRGPDKFSLVSAELEAKREELAEQLDTPLSMVKFALGSHNKWIPIVLSRSRKKGGHASKKKSAGLVPEDKSTHKTGLHNEGKIYEDRDRSGSEDNLIINKEQGGIINGNQGDLGGNIDEQSTQFGGFINGITTPLDGFISEENSNLAPLNGLSTEDQVHIDSLLVDDEAPLDVLIHKDKTTFGGLLGIQRNNLGEIIEIFPAPSKLEHISAYKAETNGLQGHNAKGLMGAAWVVSKASTFASNVVFPRWRIKSTRKTTASTERAPLREKEILNEGHTPHTFVGSSSPLSLEKTPTASPFQSQLLPLPSPPARVITASNNNTTDQGAIPEIMDDASTSSKGKPHRKYKVRGFLKMHSAPSTPRDSRQPQKPFTAASTLPKTHVSNDQAAHTDAKEERLIVHKATSPQRVLSTSRFLRASMAEKAKMERARTGQALAATGLMLSLSGLIMGYVAAILGVVCWWYLLPRLRKAVGDKPVVRSDHHTHDANNEHSNTKPSDVRWKSNKVIKEAGSDKYVLQSQEDKKKVIMEGFLDRGWRSNA